MCLEQCCPAGQVPFIRSAQVDLDLPKIIFTVLAVFDGITLDQMLYHFLYSTLRLTIYLASVFIMGLLELSLEGGPTAPSPIALVNLEAEGCYD